MSLGKSDVENLIKNLKEALENMKEYIISDCALVPASKDIAEKFESFVSGALKELIELCTNLLDALKPGFAKLSKQKIRKLNRDLTKYAKAGFSKREAFAKALLNATKQVSVKSKKV